MLDIIFPLDKGQRYYKIHYQYVLDLFRYVGSKISFEHLAEPSGTSFHCLIGNKPVLFDFGDSSNFQDSHHPQFKFHQVKEKDNVFPFPPVSFYDWKFYSSLSYSTEVKSATYKCNNDIILNNQKPYADATERRLQVQGILKSHYSDNVDFSITPQLEYFMKIQNCLVSIHVPGYCNNMLDRAQLQLMGFGCCTISPNLPELFPYYQKLKPDVHYIQCRSDYSDLVDKIEWCKKNRTICIEIGQKAKSFFKNYCMPVPTVNWMRKCLDIIL